MSDTGRVTGQFPWQDIKYLPEIEKRGWVLSLPIRQDICSFNGDGLVGLYVMAEFKCAGG